MITGKRKRTVNLYYSILYVIIHYQRKILGGGGGGGKLPPPPRPLLDETLRSVARCAFGRCWSTYTAPLSLSCAPGSGSGVPRPGGEGLVCPLRGGSSVPSPQSLVCPPQGGGSGVPPPPPPLTFVIVIVIIIIVILTIQGSDPCKYQTSPSCPYDELRRIAR